MDVPWELFICRVVPFWYAGRVLWSECKNPIRPSTPIDQSYVPTSWAFVVRDSRHFCGSQCGPLILVVVIRMFRLYWCYAALGSASCYDVGGVDFVYMKLFCCQVLLFVCFVHVSNSWVQAQWRGALIFFFFFKCTMRLQMDDAFKGEWVCDAFMRWMDDAFK